MAETLAGIKSWPKTERPRERLEQSGVHSLSDSELLAILLRSGMRGKDATTFAKEKKVTVTKVTVTLGTAIHIHGRQGIV